MFTRRPTLAARLRTAFCLGLALLTAACAHGSLPSQASSRVLEQGRASWYGADFQGQRTASGERFDMHAFTAAHKTLPFGTRVLVRNPRNGKQVVVRINDRGPFSQSRIIDLSRAAARHLGLEGSGHGHVVLHEAQ